MTIKRVYLELSNICNLNCDFCSPTKRVNTQLDLATIEHIIPQIKQVTPYIYLHVLGEPLLYPYFYEVMQILQKHEMQVQLVTNGTLLYKYKSLLEYSCLRKISISAHSLPFHLTNRTNYMNSIIETMEHVSKQAQPYVELRFWNSNQLDDYSKHFLELLEKRYNFTTTKKQNSYRVLNHVYIHFDNQFEWPNQSTSGPYHGKCYGGTQMIAILSNGDVCPCCLDSDAHIKLGSIHNESLQEILHGQRYLNLVEGFKNQRCVESFCQSCTYRQRFD